MLRKLTQTYKTRAKIRQVRPNKGLKPLIRLDKRRKRSGRRRSKTRKQII